MNAQAIPVPVLGNVDPVTDLTNSAAVIRAASWWQVLGVAEHWPLTTDEAAELLRVAGEYAIDRDGLNDLIDRGLMSRPGLADDGESFAWDASDVMRTAHVLEGRRQYRATPSFHDFKKHPSQLALEGSRADGVLEEVFCQIPDQPRFDVPHLLMLLIESNNREGRTKLATLLKAALEIDHGVNIP